MTDRIVPTPTVQDPRGDYFHEVAAQILRDENPRGLRALDSDIKAIIRRIVLDEIAARFRRAGLQTTINTTINPEGENHV